MFSLCWYIILYYSISYYVIVYSIILYYSRVYSCLLGVRLHPVVHRGRQVVMRALGQGWAQ